MVQVLIVWVMQVNGEGKVLGAILFLVTLTWWCLNFLLSTSHRRRARNNIPVSFHKHGYQVVEPSIPFFEAVALGWLPCSRRGRGYGSRMSRRLLCLLR